jgi:hypothetical protein
MAVASLILSENWAFGRWLSAPILRISVEQTWSRPDPPSPWRTQAFVMNPLSANNPALSRPTAGGHLATEGDASHGAVKGSWFGWFTDWLFDRETSSWLVSAAAHFFGVLLLSYVTIIQPGIGPDWSFEGVASPVEDSDELDIELDTVDPLGEASSELEDAPIPMGLPDLADLSIGGEVTEVAPPSLTPAATAAVDGLADTYLDIGAPLAMAGGGLEGRSLENRRGTALAGGGSEASESAVEAGLRWLVAHQAEDGSWSFLFDPDHCPQCANQCRNPGVMESNTASTGLSLLCFLGAGYTHRVGPYQDEVSRAIYYLINKMVITSDGGDLRDVSMITNAVDNLLLVRKSGDMYSHAIATLALCEAYAMTRDTSLKEPAQRAVDFIVNAQNEAGGWRYEPKQPGDLSVTGWQLMALKSGVLGRLDVPRDVWYRASEFLDSVQDEKGATYGYQHPSSNRPSMSSVGLYGRLMLGWPRNQPPLLKGAALLAREQPRESNMYFNYYTSQVLHHVGGNSWKKWNPRMRNYLVSTQAEDGHEHGSWYFDEAWSDRGGRLYTTTLAILTLEVYYRYMPMYQSDFIDTAP